MIYVSPTLQRLVGRIVVVCTYAIEGKDHFPENMSFDEGFESIAASVEHLRRRLSDRTANDLVEMNMQAKDHFLAGEIKLGAGLMQDMEQVVQRRPPFAYPKAMYRWSGGK